jgi:hypothetical protein
MRTFCILKMYFIFSIPTRCDERFCCEFIYKPIFYSSTYYYFLYYNHNLFEDLFYNILYSLLTLHQFTL